MKQVFLLGGHDLEMLEIKNIFDAAGVTYFDKELSWGAKWSDYKDIITDSKFSDSTIYGIELTQDIDLPVNCKIIDHHNELPPEPTSIEQVATLLSIALTRWQKLIAANDHGYKKAMRAAGASEDEIQEIRRLDRKAQGVTEEDERLAMESIQCHLSYKNGVTIINSLTDKFSPITDRLFGKADRLLVYTDTKLNFYGKGKGMLVKRFQELIHGGKAYHGGGEDGFFGIAEGKLNKEELKTARKAVMKTVMQKEEKEPYSTHVFMMPLRWDYFLKEPTRSGGYDDMTFDERTDLNAFHRLITSNNCLGWKRTFYRIDKEASNFNELTYFHTYVWPAIYDCDNKVEGIEGIARNKMILYYEWETQPEQDYYEIHCPGKKYNLRLDGVSIHVFNTGVMILTYNCSNWTWQEKEDILRINEFGRRFYPQFLSGDDGFLTQGAKGAFLACRIDLKIRGIEKGRLLKAVC